jgi:hypothetical protein
MTKTYVTLDGSDRIVYSYTARTDAAHGDPCLVTQYAYKSPVSTIIIKRKEYEDVWDSSYEI